MSLAPIIVLGFNRPDKLARCLASLAKCPEAVQSEICVFVDGARSGADEKAVEKTRNVAREFAKQLNISLVSRSRNLGLSASMISAVTEILLVSTSVIVVEDDLEVSPFFLSFLNEGLQVYREDEMVASIGAYWYPIEEPNQLPETFFLRGADTWGWATWRDKWGFFEPNSSKLLADLDDSGERHLFDFGGSLPVSDLLRRHSLGELESWHTRWYASTFLRGMVSLYPNQTLVTNTGGDGSGVHGNSLIPEGTTASGPVGVSWQDPVESSYARKTLERFFRELYVGQKAQSTNWFSAVRALLARTRRTFY